jgi:hypothetical protein
MGDKDNAGYVIALDAVNGKLYVRDQDILVCYNIK